MCESRSATNLQCYQSTALRHENATRTFLRVVVTLPAGAFLGRYPLAEQQGALKVTALAPKLHLLAGAGGNISILEGPDGLVMIDSGLPDATAGILAEAGKVSKSAHHPTDQHALALRPHRRKQEHRQARRKDSRPREYPRPPVDDGDGRVSPAFV